MFMSVIYETGRMIGVDEVKTISEMLKTNTTLTMLNLISEEKRKKEEDWLKQN